MMGSMMPTICSETVVIISVMSLQEGKRGVFFYFILTVRRKASHKDSLALFGGVGAFAEAFGKCWPLKS